MAADHEHHEHELGTARIEAFSDGVFAIAITLLIIEIAVPHVEAEGSLGDAIFDLWPSYFAYALSFLMIGIYWANHHSFFRFFKRTDHIFLLLNVFFLMCIAFLPFPTAVLADYLQDDEHRKAAVSLYAFGLLMPAISWSSIWLYAGVRRLTDQTLAPSFVRVMTRQYALSITVYAAAFGVSFLSGTIALGICIGITCLYLLPPRRPQYVS